MSEISGSTRARQWGQVAIRFIAAGTATGIFAVVSFVMWPTVRWAGIACAGLAALFGIIFAFASFAIIRWWIVLAESTGRDRERS